jgi:hypothetical protein
VVTNNVAEYRGLLLGLARASALGADEVESSTTQSSWPSRSTAVQGQAPDMRPLLQPGTGGAARLQAMEGALGPAARERRRRRARQPGARRGPLGRRSETASALRKPLPADTRRCRLPSPPLRPIIIFPA